MIWSAATLLRFQQEGEREIAKALKCIITRVALDIVIGTQSYDLPSDLLSITRITWKGEKIWPLPAHYYHKLDRISNLGKPLWYIFNQQGRNVIKFHPIPNEAFTASVTNLYGSEIISQVIVEYYQIPDSVTVKLPIYIRRRLLKYYVLKSCFAMEGKGQKLKAAKKFEERFAFYMSLFTGIYAGTFVSKIPVLGGATRSNVLAQPRLSSAYGEPGEF